MDITIYGKKNCQYCDKAKALLESKGIEYTYFDFFEQTDEEQNIILNEKAIGAKSYPIILIDGAYVGGHSNILTLLS